MKELNLIFFFFVLSIGLTQPASGSLSYSQKSATGELLVVESYPIAQMQFPYNANTCLAEETVDGSSDIIFINGMAVLQTSGGRAVLSNNIRSYAQPGQGVSCVFAAIYDNGDAGTSQIAGIGNDTDGFFFEWSNSVFGILYRNNSVDTIIPQSNWNVDPMDGSGPSGITLDYTNGNVYKIQYQQIEFGSIKFFIESSTTGQPALVHQIEYSNGFTAPSLSNYGLQLMAEVVSSGGNTELSISSMGLFIEGMVNPYLGIRNDVGATQNLSTTQINLLAIQNNTIFEPQTNQVMVIPDQLSLFNDSGSTDVIVSLYLNPTIASPSFTDLNSNSVVSYDTTGETFTGGILLGTFFLSSGTSKSINLGEYDIILAPGDQLVFAGLSTTSTSVVYVSVSWLEQF